MEFGGYLLNVAKIPTRARARKGEAQGVLSYQKATGIFDILCPWVHAFSSTRETPENILYHYRIRSMGCQLVVVFGPFCSEKKSNV